jgi:hypothetical protein
VVLWEGCWTEYVRHIYDEGCLGDGVLYTIVYHQGEPPSYRRHEEGVKRPCQDRKR